MVDDHPFYREGVRSLLADDEGIEIAAEATDGEAAVALAASGEFDVIVMDLAMPGIGGLEATRRILAADPSAAVLVLTMHDDQTVFAVLRAGARGYLLKHAGVDELTRAITAVHRGEAIFSPAVARRLTAHFARPASSGELFPELTDRERDVLALLVRGRSNAEIAAALRLSAKTVRNYVSSILVKLGARDRTQAVILAGEAGFP